jgi:hypothetical protein
VAGIALGFAFRLDLFVPAHVTAARRNLRDRGLLGTQPLAERIGRRLHIEDLAQNLNVRRLLIVAGRDETPGRWALGTLTAGLVTFLASVAFFGLTSGSLSFPLVSGVALGASAMALRYVRLRGAANRQRMLMGRELADIIPGMAINIAVGASPEQALPQMAKFTADQAIYRVLHDDHWKILLADRERGYVRTSWEVARVVGTEYKVPLFRQLAQTLEMVLGTGGDRARLLTTLGTRANETRLHDMQEKARLTSTVGKVMLVPMLFPLFLILAFPVWYVATGGVSH